MIRFPYPTDRRRHLRNKYPDYVDEEKPGAALTDITEEYHKGANENDSTGDDSVTDWAA